MKPKLGSLFAGIGGFDLGFELAGWQTVWQVELNAINRAVLAHRFPAARQLADVRDCGGHNLEGVDCITAGFPCTDISNMGQCRAGGQQGLNGASSGLFFQVVRILKEVQPTWVVLENVPALLSSNDCKDIEVVVGKLAECGYVGFWRVLNSQYFGVPQRRRRIFLVAGLGRYPSAEFLADAAPVESIPSALSSRSEPWPADAWAGPTFTAKNAPSRINLGSEILVAEEDGWDSMVERERSTALHGVSVGLDDDNWQMAFAAGNAVSPPVAQWIAEKLNRSGAAARRASAGNS